MRLHHLFVVGLLVAGSALRAIAQEKLQTWNIDGIERQALVFIPEPKAGQVQTAPVVFAFHGHGGTMRISANRFKYQELWPEAIIIYPQGLPTPGRLTDPQGKKNGWQSRKGDQNDRDLKFFDTMLKSIREICKIDEKRIYCTGHSNGGAFTYLLWAERGDVFAATAPACAPFAEAKTLNPKPMLHIAGTKDALVKYEWQDATIKAVRIVNSCTDEAAPQGERLTLYKSASGNPVETYIYDGGHTPPVEAWAQVVRFFKSHPG